MEEVGGLDLDCVEGNHDHRLHPDGFRLWKVVSRSWAEAARAGGEEGDGAAHGEMYGEDEGAGGGR
jgi:hypothetical protein